MMTRRQPEDHGQLAARAPGPVGMSGQLGRQIPRQSRARSPRSASISDRRQPDRHAAAQRRRGAVGLAAARPVDETEPRRDRPRQPAEQPRSGANDDGDQRRPPRPGPASRLDRRHLRSDSPPGFSILARPARLIEPDHAAGRASGATTTPGSRRRTSPHSTGRSGGQPGWRRPRGRSRSGTARRRWRASSGRAGRKATRIGAARLISRLAPARRFAARRRSASSAASPVASQLGQDRLAGRRGRDVVRRGVGPPLHLDRPVLQAALADHHAERDADQVGVLELEARPLVAVVDQDVEARPPRAASRAPRPPPSRPRS